MAISTWVYDLATGEFLRGGFTEQNYHPETEGLVEFGDADPHPDRRLQRFDPETGKRPATQAEIDAYDAARFDADALAAVRSNVLITALGLTLEKRRLGRDLTQPEQQQLLAEMKATVKALRAAG